MPEQYHPTPGRPLNRWPSVLSLAVWGLIGLVAGFVVGGLGLVVSGGLGGGVQVEVFGLTVRQGVGPESMQRVIWTWGVGVLAAFALAGAAAGMAARVVVGWAWAGVRRRDQTLR